ncbi:FliM/FliN family flagellar motor switch protein [Pseudomonas sp. Q1-7]|uniref:FliM/FliN family flagellar motor switch protein n=1 Tax=Pseudomonas sp. Q1-7 TaxID=3020843 RepID=UPI0023003D4A|nr:FliM/FliN family flagellar motor switch protein [Pseudomonas sp. Q1-7]
MKETTHKYPRIISDYFLRGYRINLELNKVDVLEHSPRPAECIYRSTLGKVGFTIDRALLAEALECYYGGTSLPSHEETPISTSEQRMRERLGQDICRIFGRTLLSGSGLGELERFDNAYEETLWEYVAELRYSSHLTGSESSLFLYLDAELTDRLTSLLAGPPPPRLAGDPLDNIRHLPVRLDCVLAQARMPLSQVLGLQLGDILTLRLKERADVRVNQQALFRGAIFEDDGTLFLTSIESVKTP